MEHIADPFWIGIVVKRLGKRDTRYLLKAVRARPTQLGYVVDRGTDASMGQKKLKHRVRLPGFVMKLGGLLAAKVARGWMSTLDYKAVFYDRTVDPVLGIGGPRIYIFWHENILIPLHLRGHCHLAMLLSQHGDAEILAHVAYHMGFDCVRGSSRRGGARALLELAERSRHQHLTITPDGPRGPRRQLAQGPIYLASRLQLPLVPMGYGSDRPWRVNSWDRFAVPRPFSRARAVIGPPLMLPCDLDRDGLENCRQRVERLMTQLTDEAEVWATSGARKVGECAVKPQFGPPPVTDESVQRLTFVKESARAA